MRPIRTALDRSGIWLLLARYYHKEAGRARPDYWLARAARAEQEAATP